LTQETYEVAIEQASVEALKRLSNVAQGDSRIAH
jgi:hypothetical protein